MNVNSYVMKSIKKQYCSGLSITLHGVIYLPDATSCDKLTFCVHNIKNRKVFESKKKKKKKRKKEKYKFNVISSDVI